jgi:glycosyltransferase involved in cell wall biosynthesis
MASPKKPKLIVQIPAYNESKTISSVIKEIPRIIPGISEVLVLVIDDGSSDNTSEVAKQSGADFIIKNSSNSGLAFTFQKGINKSLELGADIIVNTDADFQYNQQEIPKLIQPILEKKADIVSGNRQVENLTHMKLSKKYGNIIGSKVVKLFAKNNIKDASSGFRAFNKESALKLFVTSNHTYTHETLIQASNKKLKVVEIPVEFRKRPDTNKKSKLIQTVPSHIKKSLSTIIRNTLMYNSLKFFSYLGAFLLALGAIPMFRWIYLSFSSGYFGQHTQSLILGLLLMIFGGFSILIGFLSDIIAINRKHLEEVLYLVKKRELG